MSEVPAAAADPEVVLRPATAADAGEIVRLLRGLTEHLGQPPVRGTTAADVLAYGFGERPAFEAILAVCAAGGDGQAVGLALYFFTFSTWRGRPGVYVQDLFVEPAERGRGLGRRLLAAVAAAGASRYGCDHLRLSVALANLDAQKFYHRLGMEPAEADVVYHLGDAAFDALVAAGER